MLQQQLLFASQSLNFMKQNYTASQSSNKGSKCGADVTYLKILNCIGPVAGILVAVVPVAFALLTRAKNS